MKEIDFASGAAEYLQCSEAYLLKLRIKGGGPRYFKLGQRALYRKSDIDAWIDSKLVSSNAELKKKEGSARPAQKNLCQPLSLLTEEEWQQILDFLDGQIHVPEEYPEPESTLPALPWEEMQRNWEELLDPYKWFLLGLWNHRHQPNTKNTGGNPLLCPSCGVRLRVINGYCDECYAKKNREYWLRKKARMRAQDAANGIVRKTWQKIEATEETNNTFFSEHYNLIYENANGWALHVAKFTGDYNAVPDYRQELLISLWKESLYYKSEEWNNPKIFVILKVKNAVGALWRKLNTKKRVFWDGVLHLEDFKKPDSDKGSWEDFVQAKELE